MTINRRNFLRGGLLAGASGIMGAGSASGSSAPKPVSEDWYGVLVDIPNCIGCRKCEWACNNEPSNDFSEKKPIASFEDLSVTETERRHDPDTLTVVNAYKPDGKDKPVFVKHQCLHCNDPACLSACLVSAFKKEDNGAVSYDPWRCMGCRYCLVACPFQVPSYEYSEPLTPRVRKCTLCFRERSSQGKAPACVSICPPQCLTFGRRTDLLRLAKERIYTHPDKYIDHIYGEHEVGGTAWLYITHEPFEQLGFLDLPNEAPPRLLEGIQHGIFRYFIPPVMLFGLLGAVMMNFKPTAAAGSEEEASSE